MIKYKCDLCGVETQWARMTGDRDRQKEPFPESWRRWDTGTNRKPIIMDFCSSNCLNKWLSFKETKT